MSNRRDLHSDHLIVQFNSLIEAVYDSDLTETEHKILRYAASKVKIIQILFQK